ncbi:hypothetical protein C900_01289 [Fulvivirga imtechensis AK7]|uniref:Uncharacterized protein n=1 Tax=Fulvivirga imtechensis AK7 TaxID=1237149 RepID=L8JIB6_9BACT|nr:hypothetical protein C900_01289 [Fulvivirga imtechensis AK7]
MRNAAKQTEEKTRPERSGACIALFFSVVQPERVPQPHRCTKRLVWVVLCGGCGLWGGVAGLGFISGFP